MSTTSPGWHFLSGSWAYTVSNFEKCWKIYIKISLIECTYLNIVCFTMFKLESNSDSLTWSLAALLISEGIQRAKAIRKGIIRETAIFSEVLELF